jgi:hypothetical protein
MLSSVAAAGAPGDIPGKAAKTLAALQYDNSNPQTCLYEIVLNFAAADEVAWVALPSERSTWRKLRHFAAKTSKCAKDFVCRLAPALAPLLTEQSNPAAGWFAAIGERRWPIGPCGRGWPADSPL